MTESATSVLVPDNQLFDQAYYLEHNQDVACWSSSDPYKHYLLHGGWEGRDPHPLFDSSFYLEQNPHILEEQINPLIHYLTEGARMGRDPHPLFSTRYYLDQGLSMDACSFNPLLHYLQFGAQSNFDPHPLFDSNFYLQQLDRLKEVRRPSNPLVHYLLVGASLGLQPSRSFDGKAYCRRYTDVASAGVNPLIHYVTIGKSEGRRRQELRGLKAKVLRTLGLSSYTNMWQTVNIMKRDVLIPIVQGQGEDLIHLDTSFVYDVLKLLQKSLSVEDFVDVGANMGQSLLEVRLFSDDVRYIGFEPNPLAFSILEKLNAANNFEGQLFACALSDQNMKASLFKTCPTDGAATIIPQIRPGKYSGKDFQIVECRQMDDVFEEIPPLNKNFVLKIDVEGAEYKVLMGARKCISALRPIIICEVLHAYSEDSLSQSREQKRNIRLFLHELNYRLFQIDLLPGEDYRQNMKSLSAITDMPVDIYENSPTTCDFLFVPEELNLELHSL